MLQLSIVTNDAELEQISTLNHQYLKQNLSPAERMQQGFLSWRYTFPLLKQLHQLAPSIIVKDGNAVVGYALTTLREAGKFHADLHQMFQQLGAVVYQQKPLFDYTFYCMGQICVHHDYRGRGLVEAMYAKHKETYGHRFDLLLTEIASDNQRSIRAHEKAGFRIIYTYQEQQEEWNVVVWDWND